VAAGGLTFSWFDRALHNPGVRDALATSVKCGLLATAVALVLGTMASIAVARYRFFGREAVSFLVILPIALPGIVTGMALNSTFTQVLGVSLGLLTIVIGHATFCIVVVFNNVVRRLRRTRPRSRRRRPTWAPSGFRPSASSSSRSCARRSWPARCWPSR
jgi:putative spermidine/putrescine transport system permease protein